MRQYRNDTSAHVAVIFAFFLIAIFVLFLVGYGIGTGIEAAR